MFSVPVNWIAVVAGAVASMILGITWYHPKVLGTAWMNEIGKSADELEGNPMMYIFTLIGSLVTAYVLAIAIGNFGSSGIGGGVMLALVLGIGLVATAMGSHAIFHGHSLRHYLINVGYSIVNLAIMGAIIGALG
jgi:hypothetical protein